MKKILIGFAMIGSLSVFAEHYECKFQKVDDYKIIFDFDKLTDPEEVMVAIYVNKELETELRAQKTVDPDSSGDGWSMTLNPFSRPDLEFDLYFDANYLSNVYVTMPGIGLRNFKVEDCLRIKN
jgi:hypothetical protein